MVGGFSISRKVLQGITVLCEEWLVLREICLIESFNDITVLLPP